MHTIHYRSHIMEFVLSPQEGLTDLPTAQTILEGLQSINLPARLIDWPGGFYVSCELLGAEGDIVKSIRPATKKEACSSSAEINRFLRQRCDARRKLQEAEIKQIAQWIEQRRAQAAQIRHPIYRLRHKSLLDMLTEADTHGPTARLSAYQLAKGIIETAPRT